jgi:predicted amidophosphoribosyltransferase
MNTIDMAERLQAIEALLHQRRFDFALTLATKLEDRIAEELADGQALVRVPTTIRQRARSLRWAAEVGSHLNRLVRKGVRRRPYISRVSSPGRF